MNKTRVKLLLWGVLALIAVVAVIGLISGIARLTTYFQEGADPAAALNIVPNVPPDLQTALTWLPDTGDIGREMEPLTRRQMQSAYIRAWLQWNLSYEKGYPFGIETYFGGPALAAVGDSINDAAAGGWQVRQVDTTHTLRLHFYSADGSIAAFTDEAVNVVQQVRSAEGEEISVDESTTRFQVVMMLQDGNWRVRHWVRQPLEMALSQAEPDLAQTFVTAHEGQLWLGDAPFEMAGVNYYSQATPWDLFWSEFDPAVITADFELIEQMGLNTIRIFIPFEQFGGADPDPVMLARLRRLLDSAEAHNLHVIVTLFDFYTDYKLLRWPDADRHIEGVTAEVADHPALLAWDLKNQPDLDYPPNGQMLTQAWLTHLAATVRANDANHLVTVGWSDPAEAAALSDVVDFVSFHYYHDPALFEEKVADMVAAMGPHAAKPILLTEFGLPTWNSRFFPNGHSEEEQAILYGELLRQLPDSPVQGYLAWTLYDFDHVPSGVAGRWPWIKGPQGHMGILQADATPKLAADLLSPGANLDDLPAAPPRFLKPFWLTVMGGMVMGLVSAVVGLWLWRRRRRRR